MPSSDPTQLSAAGVPLITEAKMSTSPNDVFLSPRVVDDAAFERMAEELRHLISEASRSGEGIRKAIGTASRVLELYRSAGADQIANSIDSLKAAVREAQTLDADLARSRDEASLRTQRLERIAHAASDAIEQQRTSLDSIVESVRTETLKAAKELRQSMVEAKQQALVLEDGDRERIKAQVDELLQAETQRVTSELHDTLRGTYQRGKNAVEALDQKLSRSAAQAENLEKTLAGIGGSVLADESKLERLEALVAKLSSPETAVMLDRIEKATSQAEKTAKTVSALQRQAKVAQQTLEEAILDGASRIDAIIDRSQNDAA